jgi:hypothetical protein
VVSHTEGRKGVSVFEDTVLRKIFRPKMWGIARQRKLHNEEPHDLYYTTNIIRVIKSRKMRCAGHVACTRAERKVSCKYVFCLSGEKLPHIR